MPYTATREMKQEYDALPNGVKLTQLLGGDRYIERAGGLDALPTSPRIGKGGASAEEVLDVGSSLQARLGALRAPIGSGRQARDAQRMPREAWSRLYNQQEDLAPMLKSWDLGVMDEPLSGSFSHGDRLGIGSSAIRTLKNNLDATSLAAAGHPMMGSYKKSMQADALPLGVLANRQSRKEMQADAAIVKAHNEELAREWAAKHANGNKALERSLYELRLNASLDDMIPYDFAIDEVAGGKAIGAVQQVAKRLGLDDPDNYGAADGSDIIGALQRSGLSNAEQMAIMREAGIPAMYYLRAGFRDVDAIPKTFEPSDYNFVLFNDDLVDIKKRTKFARGGDVR